MDRVRRSKYLDPGLCLGADGARAFEQIERVGKVEGKRQVLRRNSNNVAVMVARIFVVLPTFTGACLLA